MKITINKDIITYNDTKQYSDHATNSMFKVLSEEEKDRILIAIQGLDNNMNIDKANEYFEDLVYQYFSKESIAKRCKEMSIWGVRAIAEKSMIKGGIFKNTQLYAINSLTKKKLISILETERKYKYYIGGIQ